MSLPLTRRGKGERKMETGRILRGHKGPYAKVCGRYIEMEDEEDSFKHERQNAYLYFQAMEGRWAVSNTVGASKCWMFAQVDMKAHNKSAVVSGWTYLDPVGRKWKKDPNVICEAWTRVKYRTPAGDKSSSRSMPRRKVTGASPMTPSVRAPGTEADTHDQGRKDLKAVENSVQALIEENKNLREELNTLEKERHRRQTVATGEKSRLESENNALEAEVKDLTLRVEKLKAEADDADALAMHVQAMTSSLGLLQKQHDMLSQRALKLEEKALTMGAIDCESDAESI
mmetsp:Transcript_37970/g.73565  ORF Transcript_37970/g.73565 Transcript_37970/m.73565 type:complete len:286 (-) Transcript_37970:54-911(-)